MNFCLIYKEKKFDNFNIVLFSIFLLIFNFLGKSNFLLSSIVLSIFLFLKIYKKISFNNFFKLSFLTITMVAPTIFAKYLIFENFNVYNLINFIPLHLPGYADFWTYLLMHKK